VRRVLRQRDPQSSCALNAVEAVTEALGPGGGEASLTPEQAMLVVAKASEASAQLATAAKASGAFAAAAGLATQADFAGAFELHMVTTAVAARELAQTATGGAVYGTGGGITRGSDPDAEHAELYAKAAILDAPYEDFGLLETMAHVAGAGVRHLDRHLDRLASSAGYFGFPFDPERARTEITAALGQAGAARVRLLLDRSGAVSIELAPAPVRSARPVTLAVDLQPVDPNQRWLYHKTTRRQTYTARARRHPTVDDVVLVNDRGQVTETTVANLAVQLDGSWYTPPLNAGCLPGVERGRLLELGRLRERDLTPEDLHRADALALVSSVRGWRPAVLAVHPPAPHPEARSLDATSRAQR